MTVDVARQLADLVLDAAADDGPAAVMLATVTQKTPLLVKPDNAKVSSISVALAAGVTVAVNDQVLLLLIPDSHAYVCLGKVTAP